jgi:hypothetical protein
MNTCNRGRWRAIVSFCYEYLNLFSLFPDFCSCARLLHDFNIQRSEMCATDEAPIS